MNHEPPWITKTCFDSHIELKLQYLKSASKKNQWHGQALKLIVHALISRTVVPRRTNLSFFGEHLKRCILFFYKFYKMNYSQVRTAKDSPAIQLFDRFVGHPWPAWFKKDLWACGFQWNQTKGSRPHPEMDCFHENSTFFFKVRSQRVIAFMEFLYIYIYIWIFCSWMILLASIYCNQVDDIFSSTIPDRFVHQDPRAPSTQEGVHCTMPAILRPLMRVIYSSVL